MGDHLDHCSGATLRFGSGQPESRCQPVVQASTNSPHSLKIISTGDDEVSIEALYVFQPPMRK